MTTSSPTVNGRIIALAHNAARALLEGVLARHGITFHQSVTLRAVVQAGGAIGRDALIADVTGSLKIDESIVRGVVGQMAAAKLLEDDPADGRRLRLAEAGRELADTTAAESAEITARLYAGIPEEDLAVAGRVLTLVTERANAELAGA
ncbi:MarR family winged helix-turn-helix transcriptional regulator [Kitasatospora sp. RB6PN24]|uniref:MarR family winged helix-turn-helix transcriptional regulator n=1 Tax=Kitasatospora humi TaxID=2893891 RepID=UPI001E348320|nr:MarR family winged helix-turn-helix transcriptional regulator [Kitasatospora humi]MCC9305804.1 MarR family winged helix-turn-helix transcriptional regulator [Kitasatospora humi]